MKEVKFTFMKGGNYILVYLVCASAAFLYPSKSYKSNKEEKLLLKTKIRLRNPPLQMVSLFRGSVTFSSL